MRILNPTENKRLNELVGFLCVTLAVLLALSMISYSPGDPSFNVAAPSLSGHAVRNWIGPAGSYTADVLFQVLGADWLRAAASFRAVAAFPVASAGSARVGAGRRLDGEPFGRKPARGIQ